MKKPANLLSIVVMVLALIQVVLMFLPYWTLTAAPTKKVPDPQPQNYSMQSLCWSDTEDMGKIFEDILEAKDEEYIVNDNTVGLVLTFVAGCAILILGAMNISNVLSGFHTASATLVRVIGYVLPFIWAYFGIDAFFKSQVLGMGNQAIYMASLVLFFAGAVVGVARLVFVFLPQKKKVA